MNNTLIIFDCFGVIFEDIAPPFLRKHLPEGEADCIKEKLFNPADLGEVSYGELLKNMSEALSMDYEKMVEEWNSMFILKKDTVDYIRKIKDKADVVLLSNAPESVVENLFEKHGIEDLFLELFGSYKLGIAKPDERIYLHAVKSMNKKYDKIYMIDDNMNNLYHLPRIGITPIHFKTAESLEQIEI